MIELNASRSRRGDRRPEAGTRTAGFVQTLTATEGDPSLLQWENLLAEMTAAGSLVEQSPIRAWPPDDASRDNACGWPSCVSRRGSGAVEVVGWCRYSGRSIRTAIRRPRRSRQPMPWRRRRYARSLAATRADASPSRARTARGSAPSAAASAPQVQSSCSSMRCPARSATDAGGRPRPPAVTRRRAGSVLATETIGGRMFARDVTRPRRRDARSRRSPRARWRRCATAVRHCLRLQLAMDDEVVRAFHLTPPPRDFVLTRFGRAGIAACRSSAWSTPQSAGRYDGAVQDHFTPAQDGCSFPSVAVGSRWTAFGGPRARPGDCRLHLCACAVWRSGSDPRGVHRHVAVERRGRRWTPAADPGEAVTARALAIARTRLGGQVAGSCHRAGVSGPWWSYAAECDLAMARRQRSRVHVIRSAQQAASKRRSP